MDYYYNSYDNHGYQNHFNNTNNKKLDPLRKRESIDSAYDSILLTSHSSPTSSFSTYSSTNSQLDYFNSDTNSNGSSLFSHPSTPVKSAFIFTSNNVSTTPDFKQQYVADINSFYFASIRQSSVASSSTTSSAAISTCSSYTSPFKTACSAASSPAKYDSFIQKRDTISSKLLRSPAFKLDSPSRHHPYDSPVKPYIKSFSSRFQNLNLKPPEPLAAAKPTPTQEEFMQTLMRNHLIPENPEFLIGSHMGLDHIDILSELNKRSMNGIVEKIFSYLSVTDCVRVGCVSSEWRSLIKQDRKRNKERVRLIKTKKYFFETFKENCAGQRIDMNRLEQKLLNAKLNFNQMTMCSPQKNHTLANQRRSLYKLNCEQTSSDENTDLNASLFRQLDVNCMENLYSNMNNNNNNNITASKTISQTKVIRI